MNSSVKIFRSQKPISPTAFQPPQLIGKPHRAQNFRLNLVKADHKQAYNGQIRIFWRLIEQRLKSWRITTHLCVVIWVQELDAIRDLKAEEARARADHIELKARLAAEDNEVQRKVREAFCTPQSHTHMRLVKLSGAGGSLECGCAHPNLIRGISMPQSAYWLVDCLLH